jgi:uncharacterized low-complexity protein
MNKNYKTPFALAIGASLLPLTAMAQTDANPFALSDLSAGYQMTAEAKPDAGQKMKDGACGEGKCGAAMMKPAAAPDKKAVEGKCAGNKPAAPADAKKMEGNCGANMK